MHIRGKLWRLISPKKNLALRVLRGKRVLLLRFQNPYSKFRSVAIMIFKAGKKAQGLRWCCFIAVDKMFNNVQHLSTLLFYILLFKYSKHGVLCVCVLGEIVSPVSTSPYHLQNENLSHDVWIHVFHSFSHSLIPEYLFPPNRETQATASRHHSQHFQAN